MVTYEVIVGNIGMVLETDSLDEAKTTYATYVEQVKEATGRAESSVVIMEDGSILADFDFQVAWTDEDLSQLSDEIDAEPITEDEAGNKVKMMFLGVYYYTDADIEYLEDLWQALEDTDMFAERGPDPCDVFVGKVIE